MSLTVKIVVALVVLGAVAFAVPHYQMADNAGNAMKESPIGVPMTPVPIGTPLGLTPVPTAAPVTQ